MPDRLPRIDRPAIRAAAKTWVAEQTGGVHTTLTVLHKAAHLADTEQARADKHRAMRDALALSLALHDSVRAVNTLIGVTRTRFYEMRCDALKLSDTERHVPKGYDRKALHNAGAVDGAEAWLLRATAEQVARRATRRHVTHHPDAAASLPKLAQAVAVAEERARAARAARDDLVAQLLADGMEPAELAEHIGRNRTRVWQVAKRSGNAA